MQSQLQTWEREAYEKYVNALIDTPNSEKELVEALEKFIRGSDQYDFLYLVTMQKLTGGKLSDKDKKLFQSFKEQRRSGYQELVARQQFLDYDISQTEAERKQFLGYICDEAIQVNHFDHTKPYQVEHQGRKEGEEDSKEESVAKKAAATVNPDIFKKNLIAEIEANAKSAIPEKSAQDYQQITQNLNQMIDMPLFLVHSLNFAIFNPKAVLDFARNLSRSNQIAGIENPTFLAAVKKGLEARKKENGNFEIDREICDKMSLEQLSQLKAFTQGGTDSNVVGAFFSKKYCDELSKETQDSLTNEEKLNNLRVLYEAAKAQGMPKSLIQDFVRLILTLGPKVNLYDKDIFKSFVKHKEFIMGGGSLTNKITQGIKSLVTDSHQNADWSHILRNLTVGDLSYGTDDRSLAALYLEHFAFLNGGVLDEFKNKDAAFLRNHTIEEIEDRVKIYLSKNGMQGLANNKRITAQLFQTISEEVSLKFLPENKDKFRIEDQVELYLEVKNVSTVHIKVFEFNTLTYYRKTLKPFDTSIDLDGLESKITRKYEFNLPANCKRKEKFVFEELAGRVGLFIFEFVGNGRSARAVVKKGSLSLIHRSTPAGHLAYIIDDSRNICKEPGTGLWLENKFYPAKEDGTIFMSYSRAEISTKVIMVSGDFAQLGEFTRKTENFQVSCQFYLNEESVLVGGKAQIMICPNLTINGRSASLKLLQNVVATVRTIDYIDETPTTKKYENLKFSDESDLTISFQVPPNLKNVNITLSCQVLNTTTKNMLDFSHGHQFNVNDYSSSTSVHELHLKMASGNKYELLYLGKNGEPMPNVPFNLNFMHAHFGNIKTKEIMTDDSGKIYIGELKSILSLRVTGAANKTWLIPKLSGDTWHYPQTVNLLAGGKFEVPVAEMWDSRSPNTLDRQQVTLVRSKQGIIIEDWFKKIQVVRKQNVNSHYFLLQVDDLEAGEYEMTLRGDQTHQIQLNVHKGNFWNNLENFILKRTCIQELVQSQKVVKIQSSSIENSEIRLRLADFTKKARVHIFATHFLAPDNYQLEQNFRTLMSNQLGTSLFTFAKWTNLLLSDRKLGDEYRYVFDRVHAERSLGNTLDRPSLLNKRIFTRKTEIDAENLNSGTTFAAQQEAYMPMMQQVMPRSKDAYQQNNYASRMQNVMPSMEESYDGRNMRGGIHHDFGSRDFGGAAGSKNSAHNIEKYYITDFQNFIKDAPLIAFNLKPDQDGNVVFKNNKLSAYSTLNILVVDDGSVVQTTKNLQTEQQPAKRDLSLKKSLNENKGLTESRSHKCLSDGQTDFIEDITSSEVMLVDDLIKVNQIQAEIRKIMGMTTGSSDWSKLQFVIQWSQLNKQTKDFYFGEYFSYELSFFIKRRDPAYFEEVVRNFIANRMEKSFVDHYLLDDDKQALQYKSLGKLNRLNAFEKCLLLEVLMRNDDKNLAHAIAKQIRERVDALNENRNTVEDDNRIFDLVLNMNSTSKQKTQLNRPGGQARSTTSNRFGQFGGEAIRSMDNFGEQEKGGLFADDYQNYGNEVQDLMEQCAYQEDEDDDCEEDVKSFAFAQVKSKGMVSRMAQQRQINMATEKFEQLEATCEYAETYYFDSKLKPIKDTTNLIPENAFWCDYADFIVKGASNFVTPKFSECIDYRQSFLCNVLLDLNPETPSNAHQYQADDSRGVTITAGSNLIAFKKEIKEVEVNLKQNFMVTHRYHRIDSYGMSNKSDDDDAIPKEFLMNVPYECEVIMTNVSPFSTDFNLLYQIPIGSMPMKQTKYMKSVPLSLSSYSTKKLSFQFYFPTAGQHGHYPSNVSIGETVTARGQFNTLNVVRRRNISQAEAAELNFDDLVQVGTPQQLLEYLAQKSLQYGEKGFSYQKILFMMKDNDFWKKSVQILRQRQIYVQEIWAYSCFHKNDIQTLREFIMTSTPGVLSRISRYFTSSLYTVDPQQTHRDFYRILEYNPMINSRAHKVGQSGTHQILNKTFRQTYDAYLQTIAFKNKLDFQDKLIYVYYLQLQDRILEAIALFEKLERPEAAGENDMHVLEIQYDYLSAYFDFFTGAEDGYKVARRIVQRYDNYPVSHWKLMFLAIQDQLDEFDGEFDQMQSEYDSESITSGSQASMLEKKQENMKNSKSKEPNLSNIQIDEEGTISIESVNIRQITVKYYMIDAEVLFSRAPFLKNNTEEFSYVKPCVMTPVQMREIGDDDELMTQFVEKKVPLPLSLKNQNLVIEINGEGKQEFRTFYSCALKVHINEAFGELKVSHSEKALGQVYVKVFMRDHSNRETFYRDGYTDIRGKFEYAITSGDKLKSVSKFSILIQSQEFGSQIKEVNPPKDDTIQAAPVGQAPAGQEGGFQAVQQAQSSLAYAKQNRMINRCNWVNSKKK